METPEWRLPLRRSESPTGYPQQSPLPLHQSPTIVAQSQCGVWLRSGVALIVSAANGVSSLLCAPGDISTLRRHFLTAPRASGRTVESKPEGAMEATAEQIRIAEAIEVKMRQLLGAGCNDVEIMAAMFDHMPDFKRLLDSRVCNELSERFPSFHRYAKILENLASAMRDGVFA